MEVTGRISVEPTEDISRLKSVSTEDMNKELSKLKDDQSKYFLLFIFFLREVFFTEKYYVNGDKTFTRMAKNH